MAANPDSILDTIKKAIGFDPEYTAFDLDITMHINAVFGSLQQLGVGPDTGFVIQDNTTLWVQYVSNLTLQSLVKTFIFMSVKLVFDPPDGRYALPAFQEQIKQLEWRINSVAEELDPPSDPLDTTTNPFQGVISSFVAPKIVTLDFANLITPDASQGNMFYLTLTADCTINAPVNAANGQQITLELTSNGYGVTWGSGWNFGNAGLPVLSGGGKTDIVSSYYRQTAATWYAGFTSGF